MTDRNVKDRFLWLLKHTLNPVTIRVARSGRGPFSLVRHVGRKTGTTYETPLIIARVPEGFIAELTYGADVSWYRNAVAAGQCVIIYKAAEYQIDQIGPYPADAGRRAFGYSQALLLKLLRRNEFRFLHESAQHRRPDLGAGTD